MKGFAMKKLFAATSVALFGFGMLAPAVQAREVKMIFGLALPPYVIQESASGYELEIIRAALAVKGHTLKPTFASFLLAPKLLKEHQADAAQRGNPELVDGNGFFYADEPTVLYQDAAISLKKNNLKIDSAADLKDKAVVGYQGAQQFLGTAFAAAVKGNPNYQESSDERRKLKMLYAHGTQVYVGDINIFKYYRSTVKADVDTTQETVFHNIFPASTDKTHNAVFLDKQIRDDFSEGLKQIKASGQYQQIVRKYIGN
jgi:polar amino acid transport system substrate-binding protein